MLQQNSDALDVASENQLAANEAAIKVALASVERPLPAIGRCHNCSEPLPAGEKFCDEFCRDDYDYIQQRRRANGG